MINGKLISSILGRLLFVESFMFAICLLLGICYGERDWATFGIPILITTAVGAILKFIGRNADNHIGRRDGFVVVSATWILFAAFGMLPLLVGNYVTYGVTDAFTEMVSGFTTTGATVLTNVDTLPHSVLFWRSLSHWIGGLGIVIFTVAFLPSIGNNNFKLFSAESSGLSTGRLHPRVSTTAKWLWMVYVLLTISCAIALWLSGMNVFDAINHSFSTIATGGFSTHQAGIMYYHSPAIEYSLIVFMFLSSINFTLLYLLLFKRDFKGFWKNGELRLYVGILVTVSLVIAGMLYFYKGTPLELALRQSFFQVVSLESTTGFVSCDYMLWPPLAYGLLVLVTCIGACESSTAGGVRCIRIASLYKLMVNEFKMIIHPQAVIPVCIDKNPLTADIIRRLLTFIFSYIVLITIGTLALIAMGLPFLDSFSACTSAFSNSGPQVGHLLGSFDSWATLPLAAKWIVSLLMLFGRLGIFSLILPFIPSFWRVN